MNKVKKTNKRNFYDSDSILYPKIKDKVYGFKFYRIQSGSVSEFYTNDSVCFSKSVYEYSFNEFGINKEYNRIHDERNADESKYQQYVHTRRAVFGRPIIVELLKE